MNALDRPRGIGYRYTGDPYSAARPHAGIDIKAFAGDPIIIGGTQIGVTGSTGMADGPHVHVQAGRDEWAQTQIVNPDPYIGRAGQVVRVGFASQWGNYVCIKVADVYVYYCHMSTATVTVGTIITERKPMDEETAKVIVALMDFVDPDGNPALVKQLMGFDRPVDALYAIDKTPERRAIVAKVNNYDKIERALADANRRVAELERQVGGSYEPINQTVYVKK